MVVVPAGEAIVGARDGEAFGRDDERPLARQGRFLGTLAHNLRTAERVPYPPMHRDDSVGIRVARTLDHPAKP
jgi:hypothetical protein